MSGYGGALYYFLIKQMRTHNHTNTDNILKKYK